MCAASAGLHTHTGRTRAKSSSFGQISHGPAFANRLAGAAVVAIPASVQDLARPQRRFILSPQVLILPAD